MTKALILAAGLGTRLRPITNHIPKALVVVDGKPLLQHALEHVQQYGIREVMINLHHFPDQIRAFLAQHSNFGMEIAFSDETDLLLDTGGGLKQASWFFGGQEPFVVRNADIISTLNIWEMLQEHSRADHHDAHAPLATLAVRHRESSRYLLFDNQMQLSGWENTTTGEQIISRPQKSYIRLAFSGIQIVSPAIFPLITETGSFPLIPVYLRLAKHLPIRGYRDSSPVWRDAGKR